MVALPDVSGNVRLSLILRMVRFVTQAKDKPKGKEAKPEAGVQSLVRATNILQAVAKAREGIGSADIAKEVGLHSSTTFHLTKTLHTLGLLRQDVLTKKYRIGPRIFSLAFGALDEQELLRVAAPFLKDLTQKTGESSHIAVQMGDEVVIIDRHESAASIRMAERVGSARPAHATAIGKVVLAGATPGDLDAYLQKAPFDAITPKTITEAESLEREIAQVRENGIAFDDGEFDPEARCLAAPVWDFRGRLIAAIGITAPVWRLGLQHVGEVSTTLKSVAAAMSADLGHEVDQAAQENTAEK